MQRSISFLCKELITCGAILSTFELTQALRMLGVDAIIVSDYENKELENYFAITPEKAPRGVTIAVSPKCEGEWAYVRTKDERWKTHTSKKIAVSQWIADWIGTDIVIGNGTHERFYDMGLERDIDVLIEGNYESNKNIDLTIKQAKAYGERVYWFGRTTKAVAGITTIDHPQLEEIPRLYNRAKVFLKASKEEGWGRPIAEAKACGVPKIINLSGGNQKIEVVQWNQIANQLIKTVC